MSNAAHAIALRFAVALNTEDYVALAGLLAPQCQYLTSRGTLVGPGPIIASYRGASSWAKASIRSVNYESSVRTDPEGNAIVTFIDHLEHDGLRHTYACEQIVIVGADAQVHRIVHHELPGQREAVDSFLRKIGVTRNA